MTIRQTTGLPATGMAPRDLAHVLASGLLSFPLTAFDDAGELDIDTFRARLAWLDGYDAAALFVCGGTGEGFSLTPAEQGEVVAAAVATSGASTPILASAGGGTRLAVELARQAQKAGAAGLLLMPHYLTDAPQEGLVHHCRAVCDAVDIGVVIYNRGVCRLTPESVERLAESCPNFISLKDGFGDIELLTAIHQRVGDRLTLIGGLPTAEVFASALLPAGVQSYSSAVFNFVPQLALDFHRAVIAGDTATTDRLLTTFFLPFVELRNRSPGYAVSLIKAGARIVGRPAGPVRSPLVDCTDAEHETLAGLIARAETP